MFAKTRYFFKLTLAYVDRFKGLILTGIVVGVALFFALSNFSPYLVSTVERIGITGRFTSDDLPEVVLSKIGSGLTKISKNGTAMPDLASSWEVKDDGKTWIFHLKDNIYWQDGKKLTSESVNFNFSDVEIEKPDDLTIIFKLKDVFVPFPTVVSRPIFKKGLLGTGEWEVDKIKVTGNYISQLTLVNKKRQKTVYRFYPTTKHAVIAFKLGQVNKLIDMLDKSDFKNWPNVIIEPTPKTNQIITVFFNNDDEFLSEKSLRQALLYAVNKEALGGLRAKSPMSPESWAFNAQVKEYALDIEHAKNLLNEIDKDRRAKIKIKLTTSPDLLSSAEKITNDWKNLGIDTSVQVASEIPTDFQAFLTILDVPVDPDQYTLWHSTQVDSNISKYKSPRVDKLLEDGRTKINVDERRQIYLDFQRFLLEDLPAGFLIYPNYYTITRR